MVDLNTFFAGVMTGMFLGPFLRAVFTAIRNRMDDARD